jgi:hypothetical protein
MTQWRRWTVCTVKARARNLDAAWLSSALRLILFGLTLILFESDLFEI